MFRRPTTDRRQTWNITSWLTSILAIMCIKIQLNPTSAQNVINRVNVGCLFRPVRDIYVETSRAHLTFSIELPMISVLPPLPDEGNCSHVNHDVNDMKLLVQCEEIAALTNMLAKQHRATMELINGHIQHINERVQTYYGSRRRVSRSWTSYWLSRLTGLADGSTVDALKESINLLQTTTERSLRAWGKGTNTIVAGMKLTNARVDSLNQVVLQHGRTFQDVVQTLEAHT